MDPLERITKRVCRLGHPDADGTPIQLLSLSEFFDGNTVEGSIGCNLDPMPKPSEFRALLQSVLDREEVKDVRVQITMFDDPAWPFSDTVWVMTTVSPDEVRSWFSEDNEPDDTWAGFNEGETYEDYAVPDGCQPVACWWD
jgi:hypothetical protein